MHADRDRADSREDLIAIVDDLLAEVQEIKRHWEEVARSAGAEPEPARPERRPPAPRLGDAADPRRLVAVEMMLAGRSRAEVEAHLRSAFGDDAAATIIASIYGEGDGR